MFMPANLPPNFEPSYARETLFTFHIGLVMPFRFAIARIPRLAGLRLAMLLLSRLRSKFVRT
jgi:hypothetical protein